MVWGLDKIFCGMKRATMATALDQFFGWPVAQSSVAVACYSLLPTPYSLLPTPYSLLPVFYIPIRSDCFSAAWLAWAIFSATLFGCVSRRRDEGSRNVVPALRCFNGVTAVQHLALALADLDVAKHLAVRLLADDRPGVEVLRRVAGRDLCHSRLQAVAEDVVNALVDDDSRTRRTLLSVEAEGACGNPFDGSVQVAVAVDDDGVLAAHFEDGPLDEHLARLS